MAAETGSGKTGAFCLPVLQIVWETLRDLQEGKSGKAAASKGGTGHRDRWQLSVHDRGPALAVTPDGLRAQSRHQKEWHGCRSALGVAGRGRFYFEATVTDEGLCRVGFSTDQVLQAFGALVMGCVVGGAVPHVFRLFDCCRRAWTWGPAPLATVSAVPAKSPITGSLTTTADPSARTT